MRQDTYEFGLALLFAATLALMVFAVVTWVNPVAVVAAVVTGLGALAWTFRYAW